MKQECIFKREELIEEYSKSQKSKINMKNENKENVKLNKQKSNTFQNNKKELSSILKNYGSVIKEMKVLMKDENLKDKIIEEKREFEKEFVSSNCKIQDLKMDIQNCLDDVQLKNDIITELDEKLIEKHKLIRYFKKNLPSNF